MNPSKRYQNPGVAKGMSMIHTVFVLDTTKGVERAVRIQVCILGSPYAPFLRNWKSTNYEEILVMTEKFSGKKKSSMKWQLYYQTRL